jgi:hypothetical protein
LEDINDVINSESVETANIESSNGEAKTPKNNGDEQLQLWWSL